MLKISQLANTIDTSIVHRLVGPLHDTLVLFAGRPVLSGVGHPVGEPAAAGLDGGLLPAGHAALPARTRQRRAQGICYCVLGGVMNWLQQDWTEG